MYDGEDSVAAVATTATTYWECPSCGHRTVEEYSKYEDAQNLFQSHIQRIVESESEDYSLDNLIDSIKGEVTPQAVWEQYARVMEDDTQVSLNCFH
jgi:DNA-directed RNA polymerase subunit N (RpoN/RPB10)